MANTSTIKSLDEQLARCQKRHNETRIYDSIKIFLENCDIDDSLFLERMKYLEENTVIYNKPTKNGNYFYISKRDRETISSPVDQTPVMKSPKNSILTVLTLMRTFSTLRKNQQRKINLTNSSKRKILKIRF